MDSLITLMGPVVGMWGRVYRRKGYAVLFHRTLGDRDAVDVLMQYDEVQRCSGLETALQQLCGTVEGKGGP